MEENKPDSYFNTTPKSLCEKSRCQYFSRGFLSEPDECSYFKEPHKWTIHSNPDGSRVPKDKVPVWCPLKDK